MLLYFLPDGSVFPLDRGHGDNPIAADGRRDEKLPYYHGLAPPGMIAAKMNMNDAKMKMNV